MSDKIINDYLKACERFFKSLIEKNIIEDVDEEILFLDVENNLRKTNPIIKNIKKIAMSCRGTIKTGKNKGNPCSKQAVMNGYCKQHITDFNEEKKKGSICRMTNDECQLVIPKENLVNGTDNEDYY